MFETLWSENESIERLTRYNKQNMRTTTVTPVRPYVWIVPSKPCKPLSVDNTYVNTSYSCKYTGDNGKLRRQMRLDLQGSATGGIAEEKWMDRQKIYIALTLVFSTYFRYYVCSNFTMCSMIVRWHSSFVVVYRNIVVRFPTMTMNVKKKKNPA